MVKFRGIEISIVSQFDIRKLPEIYPRDCDDPFELNNSTNKSKDCSVASCYVPIYSGAQVWFDYTIDAPHPPNAAYFFKMLHEGQPVTSWDCTAKHNYKGRATYNLQHIGIDDVTGETLLRRQAFRFSAKDSDNIRELQDCVEIRVHRIERRQRIAIDTALSIQSQALENIDAEGFWQVPSSMIGGEKLTVHYSLVDSGPVGAETPQRLYRYQLLDPKDKPYATFRFLYRPYEWLEPQHVAVLESTATHSEYSMSVSSQETFSEARRSASHHRASSSSWNIRQTLLEKKIDSTKSVLPPLTRIAIPRARSKGLTLGPNEKANRESDGHPGDSNESLTVVTKDSIEDLQSSVPRSPKPPRKQGQISPGRSMASEIPDSPRLSPSSPTKPRKKALTLKLGGIDFNAEEGKRPLSPFTNGGMLRKILSPVPPSAPATITDFGPSISDELEAELTKRPGERKVCRRTTRAERGGRSLMGFLGRRTGWNG